MSIVLDIVRTYRAPGTIVRARAAATSEAGALVMLMSACGLIFAAQWPQLARASYLDSSVPFDARIGGSLLGIVFMLPLVAYAVAGLLWLALRVLRGPLTAGAVRVAIFWTMLAVTPLWLAHGFFRGFLGDAPLTQALGLAVLAAFLFILVGGLRALPVARGAA